MVKTTLFQGKKIHIVFTDHACRRMVYFGILFDFIYDKVKEVLPKLFELYEPLLHTYGGIIKSKSTNINIVFEFVNKKRIVITTVREKSDFQAKKLNDYEVFALNPPPIKFIARISSQLKNLVMKDLTPRLKKMRPDNIYHFFSRVKNLEMNYIVECELDNIFILGVYSYYVIKV